MSALGRGETIDFVYHRYIAECPLTWWMKWAEVIHEDPGTNSLTFNGKVKIPLFHSQYCVCYLFVLTRALVGFVYPHTMVPMYSIIWNSNLLACGSKRADCLLVILNFVP